MSELKPCPFCGKTHIIINPDEFKDRPECRWICSIFCADCLGSICNHGFAWTEEEAKEEAIIAWNRRVDDKEAKE